MGVLTSSYWASSRPYQPARKRLRSVSEHVDPATGLDADRVAVQRRGPGDAAAVLLLVAVTRRSRPRSSGGAGGRGRLRVGIRLRRLAGLGDHRIVGDGRLRLQRILQGAQDSGDGDDDETGDAFMRAPSARSADVEVIPRSGALGRHMRRAPRTDPRGPLRCSVLVARAELLAQRRERLVVGEGARAGRSLARERAAAGRSRARARSVLELASVSSAARICFLWPPSGSERPRTRPPTPRAGCRSPRATRRSSRRSPRGTCSCPARRTR